MQELLEFSFSDQLVQMIPQILVVLGDVSLVLVVVAIKVLITPYEISCHLIWPFEEWLILNLFQNLMHRFPKHRVNRLSTCGCWLLSKVPPGLIIVVPIRLEIPPLLRDNLSLSFPLLLVFLNPFVLINPVPKLAHIGNRFASQRFP